MKINIKIILLFLLIFIISISAVSAVNEDNMTGLDTEDNIITDINTNTREQSFTDLNNNLKNIEDMGTMNLYADYKYDDNFNPIGVKIEKSITINGNGATLDGNNKGRIFFISANDVTIKNINFINGYHENSAGAIRCTGSNLIIKNCTFTNNNGKGSLGGAIFIEGDNSKITDCIFIKNTIENSGGAIRISGSNHLIENNVFKNNKAENFLGGAIYLGGNNNNIENNIFEDNYAELDGGAISIIKLANSDIKTYSNTIKNNSFINNNGKFGGALSIYESGNFNIINNTFSKNIARDLGGAIRCYIIDSSKVSEISQNIFIDNSAERYGGVISSTGNNILISENKFENNKANTKTGGVGNIAGDYVTILNNFMKDNVAKYNGGSIYIDGKNTKVISNEIINSKSGSSGGAICIKGSFAEIENNTFYNNKATSNGGAIDITSDNVIIKNNTFKKNSASKNGGAILVNGNNLTIRNNIFTLNNAGTDNFGGGIKLDGDNAKITDNIFENNTSKKGLAIFGTGNSATINNNSYNDMIENTNMLTWSGTNNNIANNKYNNINSKNKIQTILISSGFTTPYNNNKNIIITLKDIYNNLISNARIILKIGGITKEIKTNNYGQVKVTTNNLKPNSYSAQIIYNGDDKYQKCSKYSKIIIKKATPKLIANKKTFKIKVKTKNYSVTLKTNKNKIMKNTKVTLKVNGKQYTAKTNNKGQATFKITKLTKKGSFKAEIKYNGNTYYNKITKTIKITIN